MLRFSSIYFFISLSQGILCMESSSFNHRYTIYTCSNVRPAVVYIGSSIYKIQSCCRPNFDQLLNLSCIFFTFWAISNTKSSDSPFPHPLTCILALNIIRVSSLFHDLHSYAMTRFKYIHLSFPLLHGSITTLS